MFLFYTSKKENACIYIWRADLYFSIFYFSIFLFFCFSDSGPEDPDGARPNSGWLVPVQALVLSFVLARVQALVMALVRALGRVSRGRTT